MRFNADTDAGASSFAEKVKSSWENQDFTEVGQIIGRKITDTLDSIKWEGIQANRLQHFLMEWLTE